MKKSQTLLTSLTTVGSWTIISRIFGFIRDIFIATFLGSGPVAEAFLIAFSLPNMFRTFFAEGALNLSFVPIFSKKLRDKKAAKLFAEQTLFYLLGGLIILNILAQVIMPWLIFAMASGFYFDDRFELAVIYTRITFPYIMFISITALLSGVMNSIEKFAAAAAAPVLLNVIFISALTLSNYLNWDTGLSLAWAVPIAGFSQMCLLWYTASRAGFILIPKFSPLNPELKRLFRVALPAILAGGLIQINLLVGRQVASYHEGGVAWLSYADRLYQLPLGVVGISIGIVLLPNLARKLANNDMQGSQNSFNRSLEFALALTLPAAIAIIVISEPLISVLYERGAFSQIDTANTSAALVIYAFGLPAFVGQKILQPIFYARENTRTPLYFALMAMIVNLVLAVGFSPVLGYLAPAVGTTIASWCMVILLSRGSRKYGLAVQIDNRNKKILPRIFLSAILMGLILYVTNIFFDTPPNDIINKYFRAIMLIVIGFLSYICIGQVVGGFKLKQLKNYFKN